MSQFIEQSESNLLKTLRFPQKPIQDLPKITQSSLLIWFNQLVKYSSFTRIIHQYCGRYVNELWGTPYTNTRDHKSNNGSPSPCHACWPGGRASRAGSRILFDTTDSERGVAVVHALCSYVARGFPSRRTSVHTPRTRKCRESLHWQFEVIAKTAVICELLERPTAATEFAHDPLYCCVCWRA